MRPAGSYHSFLHCPACLSFFQSGQDGGGGWQSFNPFHVGFNPNILFGLKFWSLPALTSSAMIIRHYHNPL